MINQDPLGDSMENLTMQKKVETMMKSLGRNGFIVFGWEKSNGEVGMVTYFQIPDPMLVLKALAWATNDYAQKVTNVIRKDSPPTNL